MSMYYSSRIAKSTNPTGPTKEFLRYYAITKTALNGDSISYLRMTEVSVRISK